jgi:hypothetical protein
LLKTKVCVKEGRLEEFWFGGAVEGGREGDLKGKKEGRKKGSVY